MRVYISVLVLFLVFWLGVTGVSGIKSEISGNIAEKTTVRVLLEETGEVVSLTKEEYLIGCLFAQIPVDYELEALKAQAVAAHTYYLRLVLNNQRYPDLAPENADVTDSSSRFQAYFTPEKAKEYYGDVYETYYEAVSAAARFGSRYGIYYDTEPIYAVYHSVSTGKTNTAYPVWGRDFPYLKSVDSEWDTDFLHYQTTNEMTTEKARECLMAFNPDIQMPLDYEKWFSGIKRNEDGYVLSLMVGDTLLSGGDLWRIFHLRSSAFDVEFTGEFFLFTTYGYGHGVGLSQFGANAMAKEGKNWQEILLYYYTGVEIRKM